MSGAARHRVSAETADRWDLSTRVVEPSDELLQLHPGRIVELTGPSGMGATRLGYRLLAEPSRRAPVVLLDARGWMSPGAAWEAGVDPEHLVVVKCPDHRAWPRVAAALCDGIRAMVAEVPPGVGEREIRKLAALVRARRMRMALRPLSGRLPMGVAHLRLEAHSVMWFGSDDGHGRLRRRVMTLEASGKGMAGMSRMIEVEDEGEGLVRVVPGVVARPAGRAV
jgi:hypothetical protein